MHPGIILLKQLLLAASVAALWVPAVQASTVADCAVIVDNTARLACYDGLAPSVQALKAHNELVDEPVTAEVTKEVGTQDSGETGYEIHVRLNYVFEFHATRTHLR